MPVQTQLQQRRGTAASWTSTNPTLAAGEIGFESDTGKFKIGNGSTAWASLAYATNGAVVSPLTTKGDLFTYSTTNARLAVGSNGDTIVADSSTSTGLRWQGDYAAGKNKIINGDFKVNQRAFVSTTTTSTYMEDRWQSRAAGDGTTTHSIQTFTPGAAPVVGYEGSNFHRIVTTGQTSSTVFSALVQHIESVRTFAGQTVTVSFWAKANSGTPNIGLLLIQAFGSGGSSNVTTTATKQAISTSWARYSFTINVPSISGKTIGSPDGSLSMFIGVSTGSDVTALFDNLGIQTNTFDIWGVQVEAGSVATAFQTATGTIQGELAACQRYYQIVASGDQKVIGTGSAYTASQCDINIFFAEMRIAPSLVATSGTGYYKFVRNGGTDPFNSITLNGYTTTHSAMCYNNTEISSTAGNAGWVYNDNAAASVALNAEL
jgi:hypothetical protein